jgi:hypothetical protein
LPTAIYMLIQVPGGDLAALWLTLVSIAISMLALFASEARSNAPPGASRGFSRYDMLSVAVEHRLGEFRLAAAFESGAGLTALFGRSGSGKTSLVNAIAGLIRPTRGHIAVDGEVLTDTATGVFVPARHRHVGYVFQEGRLFPHLTVRQNLLYGHWFASRRGRTGEVKHVIELLGIGDLLGGGRRTCRAARSSASRSAARCWRSRAFWSWTNRWPRSTKSARPRSSPISSGCATNSPSRSSMSATPSPR